ncbi:MAG: tRNA pseudouridine(55) synthase TruB [Clostridia bacterium]|jgi:tRNA pseudouridine55 synthase|nr:tRNA pseudouridine(55) synthase TruB [Clostridia bacterium]
MNGIINVLKPPGMTSHDVVARLRRQFKEKRIGHTGTLDPQAAGVLPVCVGQATRLADLFSAKDKEYVCRLKFGVSTTTQDAWGEAILRRDASGLRRADIEEVLPQLRGVIKQQVPAYSAVKINGVPLYKQARQGQNVEAVFREVTIYSLELLEYRETEALLQVHCSKGAYIRTLCHDLGELLGSGAHLNFLLRTRSGSFQLKDSYTLEEIAAGKPGYLLSPGQCLEGMLFVPAGRPELALLYNGRSIELPPEYEKMQPDGSLAAVVDQDNNLHALAEIVESNGRIMLKPKKVFKMETLYADH